MPGSSTTPPRDMTTKRIVVLLRDVKHDDIQEADYVY